MVRPFISWTSDQEPEMLWLKELLVALGFDPPIVLGLSGSQRPAKEEVDEALSEADCLFGLVGAGENSSDPQRMSEWVQYELIGAMQAKKPIGILVDSGIQMPEAMRQAFTWRTVNLKDPRTLLKVTPGFIEQALKIKRLSEPEGGVRHPSIFDEVNLVNELFPEKWRQVRVITLTAGPGFSSQCDHSVDVGMYKTPGLSVKLADPATDLRVSSRDRPNPEVTIVRNDDAEVRYKVRFDPPVQQTETIRYRHVSVHPNIFPLTVAELQERASYPGNPTFMKEGLVGDHWDVRRRIDKLILEIRAPIEVRLSDPQLRVFVMDSQDEIEEERARIGTPKVAPHMWDVGEDISEETWKCRITITRPVIGWAYALLVRPTR